MRNHTVLVIEDSLYLAESLIDMLEMNDYKTIHASTGQEGIQCAEKHAPDLILLDIRLPDISGYEVCRRIQSAEWGSAAKIVVLTASESIDTIADQVNLPLEDILFKPEWSMQDLLHKIQSKISTASV